MGDDELCRWDRQAGILVSGLRVWENVSYGVEVMKDKLTRVFKPANEVPGEAE
jgi:hypothetical protein